MFAVYTPSDEKFALLYLKPKEKKLFDQLPDFEKKHSVIVARKMLALSRLHSEVEPGKLARIGLLHDIGKILEKNTIITKSWLVIIRFLLPGLYDRLAVLGEKDGRFRRFYLHKHHGAKGAELLAPLQVDDDLLSALKNHDNDKLTASNESIEIKLLKQADSSI